MYFTLEHDFIFKDLGRLYTDDKLIAYTLDTNKLPSGLYKVDITYSPKFKTDLPHIYNDKILLSRGFRIHTGNTIKDTNGCILVGNSFSVDKQDNISLFNSKSTLKNIISIMKQKDNSLLII